MLQNLGQEVGRGEELGGGAVARPTVGAEVGDVLCVVQDAAGMIFNQELLERDRRPGASRRSSTCCRPRDVLRERLARLGGGSAYFYR